MKSIYKKAITVILSLAFLFGNAFSSYAYSVNDFNNTAYEIYDYAGKNNIFNSACTTQGDWFIISAARMGLADKSFYNKAYAKAEDFFITRQKSLDALRIIMLLRSLEYDVSNFNGDNLVKTYVFNNSELLTGSINAAAFGLIAADGFNEPLNATVTRKKLIDRIISLQLTSGGFTISGKNPDVDVTAIVVTALSHFYNNNSVAVSINKALDFLSAVQNANGAFKSYGVLNCESTAQVIIALCSIGINPITDKSFIKNGKTAVDGLYLFKTDESCFSHSLNGKTNGMASAQALCAFTALIRQNKKLSPVYCFCNSFSPNFSRYEEVQQQTSSKNQTAATIVSSDSGTSNNNQSVASSITAFGSGEVNNNEKFIADADNENINTSSNSSVNNMDMPLEKSGEFYKNIAVSVIISLAVIFILISLVFLIRKNKRIFIKLISVSVVFIVFAIIVVFLNVQTKSEYYAASDYNKTSVNSVTVTVEFTKALDDNAIPERLINNLPDDGYFIKCAKLNYIDDDTVFDILLKATANKKIAVDFNGYDKYINGIGGLNEFDCGELSGWMFTVNGEFANQSCSQIKIKSGDSICFIYTTDLGRDIGDSYE